MTSLEPLEDKNILVFTSSATRGGTKASPLVVSTEHGQRCNRDLVLCEVSVIPL